MITPRYAARRNRSLAANDRAFAETVRLSFLKNGVADPARPAVEIEAILRVGMGKETTAAGALVQSWNVRIRAQRGELHIDRAKYPAIVAKVGDKVKALARQGEPWFEVLGVDDRGNTRLLLELGEA